MSTVDDGCCMSNCSAKKMWGWGFANMFTFAFMHHPYVCLLFGMPSLHFFYIFNVFIFLFNIHVVLLSYVFCSSV